MNDRERFQRIMHFKKPDRIPLWHMEPIIEETTRLWTLQGFSPSVRFEDFFQFDGGGLLNEALVLDFSPIPSFVEKSPGNDYRGYNDPLYFTKVNKFGYVEQRSKDYAFRGYHYLDFPIKTRDDWEKMKERYDPHDARRYPNCWGEEFIEYCNNAEFPVGLRIESMPGRGPKGGYGMGLEKFLVTIFKDPDFVHDIFEFCTDFTIELIRAAVENIKIDYVNFLDDGFAAANGPIVSPKIYKEFYLPYHKKIFDFIKKNGTDIICWYGSGNHNALIPLMFEAGFNCFAPLECAARMDAVALRRQYGNKILLIGNISRQALMEGKESTEKEFNSKVPCLMKEGGYIPALDDVVMPDISFENYKHYINLIKNYEP